mgnify:CR=1 FL=1
MKRLGNYDDLQLIFDERDANMNVSEAHGLASGMLCVNLDADFTQWVTALFDTEDQLKALMNEDKQSLMGLFQGTSELLKTEDFIFDLLLPGEEERIGARAIALSEWCQGFLYGVAYMGVGDDKDWSDDGRGVLRDLMEISRLDADSADDSDEQAFMELQEYVRMGVQILMYELQPMEDPDDDHEPTVH